LRKFVDTPTVVPDNGVAEGAYVAMDLWSGQNHN
jgi:hypothetical protein